MEKSTIAVLYTFILLFLSTGILSAQKNVEYGAGVAGIYNFQTEGFGGEALGYYRPHRHWAFVPEISYFFPFNNIHEYYAGVSTHYLFPLGRKVNGYFSLSLLYNNWINADEISGGRKKPDNFAPEGGGGIIRSRGCIRPFIEGRWDAKWREANARIGVVVFFLSCKKKECAAFK